MYSYSILLFLAVWSWALQLGNAVPVLFACSGLPRQYCATNHHAVASPAQCNSPARIFGALGLAFAGRTNLQDQPRPPPQLTDRCSLAHGYHWCCSNPQAPPVAPQAGRYSFGNPSSNVPHVYAYRSCSYYALPFILQYNNSSTVYVPPRSGNLQAVYLVVVREYPAHL